MTRRDFAAGLGAALAAGEPVRPRALGEGDTVGLITPATYVSDPDTLLLAGRTMAHFGLRMKLGRNVRKRVGYVGGSVGERLEDLHGMFADPEVKAVFCLRGGYGSAHLLDGIDYPLVRRNPKVFMGYSDITALHLAIQKKTGMVTFHGPMLLARFTEYTQAWFRKALFRSEPLGKLENPPDSAALRPRNLIRTVRPGRARGPLAGGNLSLICSLMGTPYEIDARGRILLIEDVGEEPYSLDRMLTQLRLAGKLGEAAGIIFGACQNCRPREFQPSFESTLSVGEVVDSILGRLSIPVVSGLSVGHTEDQLTLPLGVMASLDADRGELTIEGPALA